MEYSNNKINDLNAEITNDKDNHSETNDSNKEGLLSKFSIKISKKPAPATPRGVLAE